MFISPAFGIFVLVVVIIVFLVKGGKKVPIFGLILVGCIIAFIIATCEQYKEDWPDEEEQKYKSEQYIKDFHKEIEAEKNYYRKKWEAEHPEEAKKEREREQWRKENGYN